MTNVVKFPRQEDSKPQQGQPVENAAGQTSGSAMRNIMHGVIGAVYMVLVILIGTSYSFAVTIKWECAG